MSPPNHTKQRQRGRDSEIFSGGIGGELDVPHVFVSRHAAQRAQMRFQLLDVAEIERVIAEAFREGRVKRTRPRWAGKSKSQTSRLVKFAWPPDRSRAWVLALRPRGVLALTVIRAETRVVRAQ